MVIEQILLTERQTCEALSISRSALRRLMATERLRVVRIGRSVRFSADDVRRFVDELQDEQQGAAGGK